MPKGDNPGNTTDPYGNPTGADAPPGSMPRANVPTRFYTASGPYTGPTYAYTPQSGYTSLADQLSKAFSLSPTSLATPRTGLLPMYASPWAALYGGPSDPTFAQLWGQDPSQGTAPPPGTPAYIGQGGGANQPPSNPNPPPPPPATTPPPTTTPPPITNVPGTTYPGPGGTGGGTKVGGGTPSWFDQLVAMDPSMAGKYRQGMQAPAGLFEAMLPNTPDPGRDLGSIFYPGGYGKPKRGTGHNGSHGT